MTWDLSHFFSSQNTAQQLISYMKDAFFLDQATKFVVAELVTYNPELKYLARSVAEFKFNPTGYLQSLFQVEVLQVRSELLNPCGGKEEPGVSNSLSQNFS